jgi:hypothetical protein
MSEKTTQGRQGTPLQVWMDDDTKARLQALADSNGRSLSAEALHAILRHLASPPKVVTPELADVPAPIVKKAGRPRKQPARVEDGAGKRRKGT